MNQIFTFLFYLILGIIKTIFISKTFANDLINMINTCILHKTVNTSPIITISLIEKIANYFYFFDVFNYSINKNAQLTVLESKLDMEDILQQIKNQQLENQQLELDTKNLKGKVFYLTISSIFISVIFIYINSR